MKKLFNCDYRQVELDKKVDFILCDIPHNIGRDAYASNPQWWKNKDFRNGASEKANSMFFETDSGFSIDDLLQYIKDNLKPDSSAVIFCSIEQISYIINNYKKYKFKKYIPLIFRKSNSSEVLKAYMRIVGCYEYGIQLFNGKLGLFNNDKKMIKNCFDFPVVKNKKHPNEKPIELLETFIKLFTNENETVMDMCMGSGSTGVACSNLNRHFIGMEIDPKYFQITIERLGFND